MLSLAQGPRKRATFCLGYNINGFRFHKIQRDETRKTQNCGVVVRSDNQSVAVPYYRVLKEIVELYYNEWNKKLYYLTVTSLIQFNKELDLREIVMVKLFLTCQESSALKSHLCWHPKHNKLTM